MITVKLYQATKSNQWEHLLIEYLNEYCSESLTKFTFDGKMNRKDGWNKLTNTFGKVEQIQLENSYPTERKLYELFPNLRKLDLLYGSVNREGTFIHCEYIAGHFPCLVDLNIFKDDDLEIDRENFAIFLRSNPQLKSIFTNIWMDVICGTKHFTNLNEKYFQNLEKLDINEYDTHQIIDGIIHLENLKELSLHIMDVGGDEPWVFPFSSNQLESLTLRMKGENNNFNNLIVKYPSVKKLILSGMHQLNHSKIVKRMPLLEEIYFAGCYVNFTLDEIASVIQQYHSLRLFHFCSLAEICLKNLSTYLGNAWSHSFEPFDGRCIFVTLKRI